MENKRYSVGKMMEEWGAGKAQTLTFVVTNDCNLRCKYCYVTHKEKGKIMKVLMPQIKGKADGKLVNQILERELA